MDKNPFLKKIWLTQLEMKKKIGMKCQTFFVLLRLIYT